MSELQKTEAFNRLANLFMSGELSERDFFLASALIGASAEAAKREVAIMRELDGIDVEPRTAAGSLD